MKPRVLFIMHVPPPVHGASLVGKYIHDSKLINEEFECYYVSPSTARDINDIAKFRFSKIFSLIVIFFRIAKILLLKRPDLVYYTATARGNGFRISYIFVSWIRLFNNNIVVHYHNKGVRENKNGVDGFIRRRFFRHLKVILLSDYLYYDIKEWVDKKDVLICPNGVPCIENNNHEFNSEEFNILFLSNMIEDKGVIDLLKVCKLLKKRQRKFVCNFVGKWADVTSEKFQQIVKEYGIGECVFAHGAKYGAEKYSYLKNCDCFVFPSFYGNECLPLVLMEVMQYGIPCISTRNGAIMDCIDDGSSGFLVDVHDVEGIANKIEFLMDNSEVKERMGKNSFEKFKNEFTLDIFEKRIVDCLKQCLHKSGEDGHYLTKNAYH